MRLLNEAHDKAESILKDKRDLLDRLSALLLVTETIDGPDLQGFADGTKPIPTPDEAREVVERKAQEAAASAGHPEAPVIHPTPVRPVMPPAPPLPAD